MEMFGHVPCGRKVYHNGMETNMSIHLMTNDYTVYRYTKQTEETKMVEYFAHVNPDLFNTIDTVRIDSKGVLEIFFNLSFTPFEDGVMCFKTHDEYKTWYESMKNEMETFTSFVLGLLHGLVRSIPMLRDTRKNAIISVSPF